VLADSEPHWDWIDADLLREHGFVYAGEHKQQVLGKSFALSLQFYKDTYGLQPTIAQLIERRQEIAADYYAQRIEAFEDAPGVLRALRARGLRIGLATSSLSKLAGSFLERYNLREFFDAVTTGEEVVHGKPHPDIYLRAAAKLDAMPEVCLVVEDSLAGVQAGRDAGMTVAAIPDPRYVDAADYNDKADYVLSRLSEVPELFRRQDA
jgi:HAD superfamily hydrolase (TIGR01509 family)